jgi:urea transport system permease protein
MLDSVNKNSGPSAPADDARSLELFQKSQTFMLRTPDVRVSWLRLSSIAGVLILFFLVIPLLTAAGLVADYKVNILGKYLCFAIVALGIDLIWGYTGLLSLCQALFFALGAYAMAMHLSLPEGGGQYDYPQFMTFAYYGHGKELPWFWAPFRHFSFALFAGVAVPGIAAGLFGFFILRSRVRGVYFSIVTQALAQAAWLLISRNEMLLGGTNGLTNFYKPMSQTRGWIIGLYLLTLTVLVLCYLFCRAIVKSRLGRVLIAVRDKETRLYFAGYQPYAFKVFAFSVGAMIAGIGGMLYSPQVGIITPQDMNVEASILMVVMVALGGRGKLWGAVFGALLLRIAISSVSSDLPSALLLVIGLIAVFVVLILPDGFAGLWEKMERELVSGGNFKTAAITVTPLAAVALFMGLEALNLTPRFLQGEMFSIFGVAPKYVLLVAVLAASGIMNYISRRNALPAARGFEVLPAPAIAATPVGKTSTNGGA